MHGELLIKTHKATVGRNADGYVDAYDRYGLSLDDGTAGQLIMATPDKEPVGYSNALSDGVSYLGGSVGVKDEHTMSLEAHIYAPDEAEFLRRHDLFVNEVCNLGRGEFIRLKTKRHPNRVYRVMYRNFQQFTTFNMEMAMFMWVLKEPHPELRDASAPNNRHAVVAVVETDDELDALIQIQGFLRDGDLAVVTAPSSGNPGNRYLRLFGEDVAEQGGPGWEIYSDEPLQAGDYVKNITDGYYWGHTESGTWKRHWY